MATNSTSAPNATTTAAANSTVGLAVGLPLFFLAVATGLAALAYVVIKRRGHSVSFPSKAKDPESHGGPAESRYSGMGPRGQATPQNPVYENIRGPRAPDSAEVVTSHSRSAEPDDLYIECESDHDAIYCNDPSFAHCSPKKDNSVDDVYLMPDA